MRNRIDANCTSSTHPYFPIYHLSNQVGINGETGALRESRREGHWEEGQGTVVEEVGQRRNSPMLHATMQNQYPPDFRLQGDGSTVLLRKEKAI